MRRWSPWEFGILLPFAMSGYASETSRLGETGPGVVVNTFPVAVAVLPFSSSKYGHT